MNLNEGIHSLKNLGLNIFLSAKVSEIPADLFPFQLTDEQKKKTLIMIGHGGKTLWKNIPDFKIANPIDTFSKNQMTWFAENILKSEIEILFPNDEVLLPLQKLGRFFNLSHQSPLGLDISEEYGLWFAFRGVFLTEAIIPSVNYTSTPSPCDTCSNKLCLSVDDIYNARMKCPIKNEHQYTLSQRTYHQSIVVKPSR